MLATGHSSKGIWNAAGPVSLCLISDLEALVEATILYGKLQIQFQKQILSITTVRKIFVCFFNIVLIVTCGYKAPFFFVHYIVDDKVNIQGVPGGKVNILRGHSIGHSKQKCLYEHVSYS